MMKKRKKRISIGLIFVFACTIVQADPDFPLPVPLPFLAAQFDAYLERLSEGEGLPEIRNFAQSWDRALVEYMRENGFDTSAVQAFPNYSGAFQVGNEEQLRILYSNIQRSSSAVEYFASPELQEEFIRVFEHAQSRADSAFSGMELPDAFNSWKMSKILILNSASTPAVSDWNDVDELWVIPGTMSMSPIMMCIWFCCDNPWWRWWYENPDQ